MYKKIVRPVLFQFDPEAVHNFTMNMLSIGIMDNVMRPFYHYENEKLKVKVGNLTFRNPIGLAAGMDKNCTALHAWDAMGFGFAEVGTVTPLPQEGNPKPRMFRLPEYRAIINRLGFNNHGADEFEKNIHTAKEDLSNDFITGVNIGKNKRTPLEEAYQDYKFSFEKLYEYADYFTINVSSPNTEGLRELQQKKYIDKILNSLQQLNKELDRIYPDGSKDIFLKIAPDLTEQEIGDIIEVSINNNLTGIIATNTTISRESLPDGVTYEIGGLSGKPLKEMANNVIKFIKDKAGDKLAVIACGGVFTAKDVKEKLDLGASLVQMYTGFIYEGPFAVKKIKKRMVKEK
ncbi:MAG: quinone-dependent dihydroorotate dehydrogenase [Ignavibacteriae bacterium]|nr:MAG: quinone-dependent dihydroorotate dehydrogenase [Ignavibacteriota bacterium]